MDAKHVVKCLAALAHLNRFEVFRALVQAGPTGMTPGMLNENLAVAPATMSFHLKELANAELVDSRTEGRRVIYFAKYETIEQAVMFVMTSCCAAEPAAKAAQLSEARLERLALAKSKAKAKAKVVALKPPAAAKGVVTKPVVAKAPGARKTVRRSQRAA